MVAAAGVAATAVAAAGVAATAVVAAEVMVAEAVGAATAVARAALVATTTAAKSNPFGFKRGGGFPPPRFIFSCLTFPPSLSIPRRE